RPRSGLRGETWTSSWIVRPRTTRVSRVSRSRRWILRWSSAGSDCAEPAASRVEQTLHDALPGIDVVVHVEPRGGDGGIRERILAAALTVSHVREIHNLTVLDVDGTIEISLHLKLPGDLALDTAHDIAEQVESAILTQVP